METNVQSSLNNSVPIEGGSGGVGFHVSTLPFRNR
jgi:hypothetical protein